MQRQDFLLYSMRLPEFANMAEQHTYWSCNGPGFIPVVTVAIALLSCTVCRTSLTAHFADSAASAVRLELRLTPRSEVETVRHWKLPL